MFVVQRLHTAVSRWHGTRRKWELPPIANRDDAHEVDYKSVMRRLRLLPKGEGHLNLRGTGTAGEQLDNATIRKVLSKQGAAEISLIDIDPSTDGGYRAIKAVCPMTKAKKCKALLNAIDRFDSDCGKGKLRMIK